MKTVIHVNQHIIKNNAKTGADDAPLTVKTYRDNRRAYTAEIHDAAGNVVARVVNRPHDPLSCGARVWIEAYHPVSVVTEREQQGDVSDEVVQPLLRCGVCGLLSEGETCSLCPTTLDAPMDQAAQQLGLL